MKPVRLPAAATLALPRWAIYALGLLYILPGLIGREPWKADDAASFGIMWTMAQGSMQDWLWPNIAGLPMPDEGPLAFWLGAACIKLFGWLLGDVLAARVSTVIVFLLGVLSLWYVTFALGRRQDAQPLKLAFGGQPEPDDFGRTLADAASLIYLGCLGLLVHSHVTTAEPLQVALLSLLLYRSVRYMELPSVRNAALIGLALGLMVLARGWLAPAFLVLALFLCSQFLAMPAGRTLGHLAVSAGVGALATMPWLLPAVLTHGDAQLSAWMQWNYAQIALPTPQSLGYFLRVGVWFFWPAWPFAAWAVYAWRRQRRVLHIVVPVTFTGMATLLALCHPAPEQGQLLLLLPPLAIMAAFGLLTMKRGAINAIDWFSVMVLTLCAATLWLFWSAMLTGWPAKAAHNALKLVPGFHPEFRAPAVLVAFCATVGWFMLVHWRLSRQPAVLWRAVVLSSGGLILVWILAMTLFLPAANYSKSYATVARQAAAALPAGAGCVETNVAPAQRASFVYFGKLPFGKSDQRCAVLLLQDNIRVEDSVELAPQYRAPHWEQLWEGRRASDRQERFRLYRRLP
ncbi:glycosyltransferase [Massilia sp. Root418]|jgi:4-amino-4-deoxy-L-arabinose transferase-like glycosyltransferase|uniref:ArnT family glycosyltransferase n=1 Tax=Massilia sp. Root418 TaxID=1736532 RepID=UPI0006FBA480|nr:glycosyl transferase [Massilia sp. Root418]KQW89226.1 glycosyltransferase [Massilia sp. Root418]